MDEYNKITEKDIDDILDELVKTKPKSKMTVATGKYGYIDFIITVEKKMRKMIARELSEEEETSMRKELDETLEHKLYII